MLGDDGHVQDESFFFVLGLTPTDDGLSVPERASLKPLPKMPWEFARWAKPKVNPAYHVEYDDHFYSVPFSRGSRSRRVDTSNPAFVSYSVSGN